MELALYEFESAYPRILSHLDTDHEDPATRHCINQATHHLKMVREYLSGVVIDPQTHYSDDRIFYQTLWKVLPLMALIQSFESPPDDQVEEENLPDTQSSDQSDQDTYAPATPTHQSES